MADNTTIKDAAAASVVVASDDIGGVQYQRVKVTHGADGVANDATAATPLPVSLATDLFGSISTSNGGPAAFFELFDVGVIDTTTRWNTFGTVTPAASAGSATLPVSNTASATSVLSSIPSFPLTAGHLLSVAITLETVAVTGNHRFWGIGQVTGGVGTSAAPITDGVGFEVDTTGVLRASVYAAGVRTTSTTLPWPSAGPHTYFVWSRGDVTFFAMDQYNVPVAQSFSGPQVQVLPVRFASLNSATPSAAPTMTMTGLHVSDLSGSSTQISDGTTPWRKVQVGKAGGLSVKGAQPAPVLTNFAATNVGNTASVDVSEAGNVTFVIKNTVAGTAFTGTPVVVFEQSDDNVSWGALQVVRSDNGVMASTQILVGGNATNTEIFFDAAVEGVNWVRARLTTGTTANGLTINVLPGGMPFSPYVALIRPTRTAWNLSTVAVTAPATATEALVTLSSQRGTAASVNATSFSITNGRTFRIQSINVGLVGNATATVASMIYRLRINTAGAIATTSTIVWQHRLAIPAVAGQGFNQQFNFDEGLDIVGTSTLQFGMTILPTFVTNAPTYDVTITGYEF